MKEKANMNKEAIALLKKILKKDAFKRMNKGTVVGFLGELIVKQKLEDEGYEIKHSGNCASIDLLYKIGDKEIKIDVKTSRPKDEISCGIHYWGWPLSKSAKQCKCSHYICVALDKDYNVKNYFVINVKEIEKFPNGLGQFSTKVNCAFIVFPKGKYNIKRLKQSNNIAKKELDKIQLCQSLLKKKTAIKVAPNGRIGKLCK